VSGSGSRQGLPGSPGGARRWAHAGLGLSPRPRPGLWPETEIPAVEKAVAPLPSPASPIPSPQRRHREQRGALPRSEGGRPHRQPRRRQPATTPCAVGRDLRPRRSRRAPPTFVLGQRACGRFHSLWKGTAFAGGWGSHRARGHVSITWPGRARGMMERGLEKYQKN
jgi:hypothetical protein